MLLTETRRRRRESGSLSGSSVTARAPSAPTPSSHYRALATQLQNELARVAAALETRATSLEALNAELHTEVATLRDELTAARERETQHDAQLTQQATQWREQYAQLTREWDAQQTQWANERDAYRHEHQRVVRELHNATQQLALEQQRNAVMSQDVQHLQCRVDTAVQTAQSFETRLQQLQQLRADEKCDWETQMHHLTTRLQATQQKNKQLTDALVSAKDKSARQSVRKDRPATSDASISSSELTVETKRRVATSETTDRTRKPLPQELDETKRATHRFLNGGGSALSGFLSDLQSHAPTSPTSSTSPTRSPRSLASSSTAMPLTTARPTTTTTSISRLPTPRTRATTATRTTTTASTRAAATRTNATTPRMEREMERLRKKWAACEQLNESSSVSPRWR